MWAKEMFLKKKFNLKITKLIFIFVILSWSAKSDENAYLKDASTYLSNLNEFSSSFVQIQNNEVSEGLIFIKERNFEKTLTTLINPWIKNKKYIPIISF